MVNFHYWDTHLSSQMNILTMLVSLLLYSPSLVRSFNLNYLNLWLKTWLTHPIPHKKIIKKIKSYSCNI